MGAGASINEKEFAEENEQTFLSRFQLEEIQVNVFRGTSVQLKETYLLKKFWPRELPEVELMKSFSHPNLLSVYHIANFGSCIYGVFEYSPSIGLDDRLSLIEKFNESRTVVLIRQLCRVVEYLHQKNLFHLDLKLANLLVPLEEGIDVPLKLCDVGFALSDHTDPPTVGTPFCLAPEIFKGQSVTPKVDIWSIGIIAYLLLCGHWPFKSKKRKNGGLMNHVDMVLKSPVTFEEPISKSAQNFICKCLEKKPSARPSAVALLQIPWLTPNEGNEEPIDVDQETVDELISSPREYSSVLNEDGATYGIQFKDLVELLQTYATKLNQPMTMEKIPGCRPLYGGLTAHHLREYFVKEKIYLPTDSTTMNLFIKCNTVHVAVSYSWRLPLLGVLDLLRGDMRRVPVRDEDVVWLDILVIDQNAPDLTKALSVSKQIYEQSDRHYILTVSCFDRTWCLYEMFLRLMSTINMSSGVMSENHHPLARSEFLEFRASGGSSDEKDREKTLRRLGQRNILNDMEAYLAVDREAVRSSILNMTTEAQFNGMIRAIYADFARRRRCSARMQALICYYLGGKVSNSEMLETFISDADADIRDCAGLEILDWMNDDTHLSLRQLPILFPDRIPVLDHASEAVTSGELCRPSSQDEFTPSS
jgi:calcium/calmodulin-dependent protein kinase I